MNWNRLAEHQIRKAQAEGQLDDLAGSGKPLKPQSGNEIDGAGFRIMAEAGVIPREIELKKAIEAQRVALQAATGEGDRKREMQKLADLEMCLAIEEEARRKFYRTS